MTKETMLDIIGKHNESVDFINTLDDVKIPMDALMRLMPLSCKHANLGLALTHEARSMGIDAKCCMQSGKIMVYGKIAE